MNNNRTIEKRRMADDCELWLLWDNKDLVSACFLHSTRVNKNIENKKNVLGDIFDL